MSKIQKIVAGLVFVAVAIATPIAAATTEELQAQINLLLAQLSQLQSQLNQTQGTGSTGTTYPGCAISSFDRNLSVGMTGSDVKCLQVVLNSAADTQTAATGVGSSGNETEYFGSLTKAAVVKFQEKYAAEVLASYGLTSGTGYVGSTTRAKLNSLLAAASTTPTTPTTPTDPTTPTTPTTPSAEGLTVTLASDTPASAVIADNANANFTKVTLAAGSASVSVSSLYVTRAGLSTNSSLENIKIVDVNGVSKGTVGSLNTNNKALISFVPALVIPANTSVNYYIRAGFPDGTSAGLTASLGIAAATDVSAGGAVVNGAFPVTGNAMSVVSLTIGTASIAVDGTVSDSTPDVGATDVTNNQFKISAGATEAITIEQITVMEAGTAAYSDIANIELYSVTDNKSLGTVANWDAEGKVSFPSLNIVVEKGETHRFKVKVDIVGGSGLTSNSDVIDGTDTLITVKGNNYGFYITPTIVSSFNGKGANDQTIQSGSLAISKSTATPATGNISPASDQILAVFDFDARGEGSRISSLKVSFDLTAGFVDGTDEGQITNVKIYDENGTLVAGPQDLSATNYTANSVTYEGTVTFTDLIIVPVGVHKYTVKAKIANDTTTGDALKVAIADADTDLTVKGSTTNDSITASPAASAVAGNTQTVAAGAFSATTLTSPAAASIAKGVQDFVFAVASLSAIGSGEDVYVTAMTVKDTVVGTGTFADLQNVELWADLTSGSSARGDIYETKVGNAVQMTAATKAITLNQTIIVPKGTFVKVAVVGDLATGATTNDTHTVNVNAAAGAVSATGADTGTDLGTSVTPTGAGQSMTVAAAGTLVASVDSSSPVADILIAGTEKATLGVFRLTETGQVEDLDLYSFTITDAGAGDVVNNYYFYHGDTLIAIAAPGSSATVYIAAGTVTIPKDDYVLITVKGDLRGVDGTAIVNGDDITLGIASAGDVVATGKSSGASVSSTGTGDAAAFQLYQSRPYFAANSTTPSGNMTRGASVLVAKFDITANAAKDINFTSSTNSLVVSISAAINDTADGADTFTLKNASTGATLDTATAHMGDDTTVTFDFTTANLTVPAGQTKTVEIYADTAEFGDAGDTLYLYLDDASGTNVDWGINGSGSYNEAAIIFKGDINAGTFVTPSGSSD
ncbi:MAG: hypothetical protein ABH919_01800 [bacterium]